MWNRYSGRSSVSWHHINMNQHDVALINATTYRAGLCQQNLKKQKSHLIMKVSTGEPATTDWASLIVFVPTKDGCFRFCVFSNYLNTVTTRENYPFLRMDECVDSLGSAQAFLALEPNSGYWQIEMDPKDVEKTAFVTHHSLYRYTRISFGFNNAPATLQRAMNVSFI